jgi:hypothetical protein
MNPSPNVYSNRVLGAPESVAECESLEIADLIVHSRPCMVSAWEPSEEEIAAINRGERIWLFVYGRSHPMVWLTAGERPV